VSSLRRRRLTGVALALVSATGFGLMPVLGKVAYDDGAEPVGRPRRPLRPRRPRCWCSRGCSASRCPATAASGASLLLGGVGYVAQALCFFFALERSPRPDHAAALRLPGARGACCPACCCGSGPRPSAAGCVAAGAGRHCAAPSARCRAGRAAVSARLASALVYAVYILTSSRVTGVGAVADGRGRPRAAAVSTGALAAATRPALPSSATAWLALLGVALVGTVVAVTALFAALSLIGPTDTSVLSTFEPVVSVAAAGLVLGERLSATQVAGGAVVLLAVTVLARAGSPAAEPEAVPA
jgi:drug/metabolite transporter (DMT)-like permease